YSSADICAFTKKKDQEKVFVLSNLRNKEISYEIPKKLLQSKWINAFTGVAIDLNEQIKLAPYSYLVLKN
ncbi:MAG: hypothetical protein MUP99_03890, partial [Pedobacter sp.]|nr:hypothetical protein [Pedobacter sp.]